MTEPDNRREINADYLKKALAWLELRLRRLAGQRGCKELPPFSPGLAALVDPELADDLDEQIKRLAGLMEEASWCEPSPWLVELADRLELSRFETELLLLCVGVELETIISELCARVQPSGLGHNPTFALALALFDDAAPASFAPGAPLRRWRLIEINQPGAQPLITSPIRADERVVNYALGQEPFDDRLSPWFRRMDLPRPLQRLPHSQLRVLEVIRQHLRHAHQPSATPLIQLVGPDAMSKEAIACRATRQIGFELDRIAAEDLPAHTGDLETLGLLWRRECRLQRRALYLDAQDLDQSRPVEGTPHPVARFLAGTSGLIFLAAREPWTRLGRPSLALDVAKPTPGEQKERWERELGDLAGDSPALLAGQFNLNTATIVAVVHNARADGVSGEKALRQRLWDGCRNAVRPRLDNLAERLEPKATLRDLVLPREAKRLLRQIVNQVRYRNRVYEDWGFARKMSRGLGLSVLFSGESGTGKTMAAEALSNRLRLDLFRIDLSAVVSKYIGETEKNLRRVFDAAEDGGALLFFDEADALFGKRSEVKDSHDRYSNIEINYLLQRMEAYRGLAILATNMKRALDTAFLRRLRFLVDFPFPAAAQRLRIWKKAFPAAGRCGDLPHVPVDALDYTRLSTLDLTGGSIANVALNASFLAARRNVPVDMPAVLRAARDEYVKLGRPISESDFAWNPPAGVKS
ncbi:MAG: ATP-binding protein [Candidatus Limnocylindrales bacterium]